ncbi:PAS domain-containing sensor histidine kinase [Hymenobacter tenuis]
MDPVASFAAFSTPEDVLRSLLAISPSGVIFCTPLYGSSGEISDFQLAYVNPAAQHLLGLPEHPVLTLQQHWSHTSNTEIFAFLAAAYASSEPSDFVFRPRPESASSTYRLAAQRSGQGVLVTFSEATAGIFAFDTSSSSSVLRQEDAVLPSAELAHGPLHHVFRQAPVGICLLTGPDLVFELINPVYQALLPTTVGLGQPFVNALPDEIYQLEYSTIRRVFDTGETHEELGRCISFEHSKGEEEANRYLNFVYQALREDSGPVRGVLICAFDVTEQVVAAQQLAKSREKMKRFKFMADQARDAFILMREDGTFAYLNHKAREAWGYSAQEIKALRVPDVDVLYQQDTFAQLFARAQQGTVTQFETQHRHKDGHIIPVEVSLVMLQLGGKPHLLAVARDITEQKRTLAALRESEERFRIMADAAPNQVWAVNPDSSIRYVNQAFLDFVGVSLEEYMMQGWSAFMHPEELAHAQHTLEQAIQSRSVYMLEHRMRRHDGEFRWLLSQGAPSYFPNGDLYGYIGSAIDITELKQTNEQLVRTNIDLDTFIYTASHDLREPITNLLGLVQALQEQLPRDAFQDPLVPRLLTMMQESVARFQLTIAQLTDLAQLQQAQLQPAEAVDVAALVESVRMDLAPRLAAAGATLNVEMPSGCAVSFAPKHLRSIIYNLLSNAVKYRNPHRAPHISLHCQRMGSTFKLAVQDNGLGLDEVQQARLFGLFQRLHHHVEGSGIGLYMVKRIIENAGGTISVLSELGVGSTFTVLLPGYREVQSAL